MSTLKQIEANRRNALKSTGPTTPEGKERSRRNALRHGLTSETVIVVLEDPEDYQAFEAAVIADYDAETVVEREMVLRLASILWRLRRATGIETALFETVITEPGGLEQPARRRCSWSRSFATNRSMVATPCPDLIKAIAMCMATVDLPDPPFSLPTRITCAGRVRAGFSTDMGCLNGLIGLSGTLELSLLALLILIRRVCTTQNIVAIFFRSVTGWPIRPILTQLPAP